MCCSFSIRIIEKLNPVGAATLLLSMRSDINYVVCVLRSVSASVAGCGVRVGTSGPERSGSGEEAHAAALQILGQTQHGPHQAESSLLLY